MNQLRAAFLIAMGLTACSSSLDTSGTPSATTATTATSSSTSSSSTGGAAGNGGSGGTAPDPDKPDHEALEQCGQSACPTGFAQRIEGGEPFAMNNMECIVTAMRDRTSGIYHVDLNHTWGNGDTTSKYTLFITPTGAIEVAEYVLEHVDFEPHEDYKPTTRCALKPASFFEACLTAVSVGQMPGDDAWQCVFPDLTSGLPWFDGCTEQPPTCE
jgi:hypothetical protein